MIYPQIQNTNVSVKNEKTIFYFEFLFDLYGYHCYQNDLCLEERYIINNIYSYTNLTEKHIKKLNFSEIEIYVDNNLIDSNDIIYTDLDDTKYLKSFRVMRAHCYFIYNSEKNIIIVLNFIYLIIIIYLL